VFSDSQAPEASIDVKEKVVKTILFLVVFVYVYTIHTTTVFLCVNLGLECCVLIS